MARTRPTKSFTRMYTLTAPDVNSPTFDEEITSLADNLDEIIQTMIDKLAEVTGKTTQQINDDIEKCQDPPRQKHCMHDEDTCTCPDADGEPDSPKPESTREPTAAT